MPKGVHTSPIPGLLGIIGSMATLNLMLGNILFWIQRTALIDANPDVLTYALELSQYIWFCVG